MNGRTFYAGEAGGSRVILAASPRLTPLGLYGHSHRMPSKPTGRKAAGESSTTRPPRGRRWRLPRHRLEPVGKLRIRPLAVKLRGGQPAGSLAIRGEAGAVGGEARDRLGKR